ncbi:putative ATP-dependent RNA helicase DHX57 [Agrilus planipennis]|uniref:RNA helicase n=1 Tax=Agrilus planipennis TaxID=224129 RepID=A0A7F5RAB9_AGRPL|nr:putative ATP-dependent RNA helicase DHX57 [Agrilus planipennis]
MKMNSEEAENNSDFFLREIPNIKIGREKKTEVSKKVVKEELQVLRLSSHSQKLILKTLKYIYGPDFTLDDALKYKDQGNQQFRKKFWVEKRGLVVKGSLNNCSDSNSNNEAEQIKEFAILRLESYGFHKNHCKEALEYCEEKLEDALQLLYQKYFKTTNKRIMLDHTDEEITEQRQDEKEVLTSIFEAAFQEKISNSVWLVKVDLDYLVKLFNPKKPDIKKNSSIKPKDICRNFKKGHCKYGNKCRFLHEELSTPKDINAHLNKHEFSLEFRFPEGNKYPFEPPLIFLKTNYPFPEFFCLNISKRLYLEAIEFAKDGIASVYPIVEFINNKEAMLEYINNARINFPPSDESIFSEENEKETELPKGPSHYDKGITNVDKKVYCTQKVATEDKKIIQSFLSRQGGEKYKEMLNCRKNLPAWKLKNNILNTLESAQIVVISGETGCGKSTQVPQYILDDWITNYNKKQGKHVEIICTQPRRISAIGVAERVAEERIEKVGQTVGYQIRLESKISNSTRLTFCTTGILLRRLESDPFLSSVSHVIVDEVHERSEESDFLLLILKEMLLVRKDIKVILMSATLNSGLFSDYFSNVPILEIPGRTFPVEQYFLEDILEETGYILEENTPYTRPIKKLPETFEIDLQSSEVNNLNKPKDNIKDECLNFGQLLARYEGYSRQTCKNLYLMDPEKVNLDLLESVLSWIVDGDHNYPREGTILIFLPGIGEITALYDQLKVHPDFSPRYGRYVILPLHSSLTSEEQASVFRKPKNGARKIVISTNIAETSVTIDDCVFVVDAGKMKEKYFDSSRNMESLELVWETKANALQRKGRAGRVMPGVCIHLFTNHRFKHHFKPQPIPEIQRISLEQLILHIKILPNFEDRTVNDVLDKLIEPPEIENINAAIFRLQNVGALDDDNNLTPLGQHLAALPVDVRIGKLMLYGAIFSCVDATLTIASCLSYKSPFVTPFDKKEQANAKKRDFALACSDHLTVLRAYRRWQEVSRKGRLAGQNFANENYLSIKTLETLADTKHQFLEYLVSINFVPVDLTVYRHRSGTDKVLEITKSEFNRNDNNAKILSAILCTALYPNVVKVLTPQKTYIASVAGAVVKETEAKELKFRTINETVFIHPSSVNFIVKEFSSPYLVFQEKVKTSKIFIKDCTMVPFVPLVLFSGCIPRISVHNGITYLSLEDGWIMFQVENHQVAEMIKVIRLELLELLKEKIKDPLLNLQNHEKGEKIISTIIQVVTND